MHVDKYISMILVMIIIQGSDNGFHIPAFNVAYIQCSMYK